MANTTPPILSKAHQGQHTESWRFLTEDRTLEPAVYGQLIQLYGDGLTSWDAFMLAGHDIDVSTRNLRVISQGSILNTVDVDTEVVAGAANANLTFISVNDTLRVGFVVHVPAKYQLAGTILADSYRCKTKTYNATVATGGVPGYTYVCEPLIAGQRNTVNIPVGQKLIIGGSMFAAGTQQPAGMVNDFFDDFYGTRILKESTYYEGGQVALKERAVLGSNLRARGAMEAQLRLRQQLNDAVLMGRKITKSGGLTQANRSGEANQILSSAGLLPTMIEESMKLYYTGSFNEDQLDAMKAMFASQGVIGSNALLMSGPALRLGLENAMLTWVKSYSGGSDLYDKLKGVGFGVSEITKNGFKTYLTELPEFSNPMLYGATGFNFGDIGMIFPDTKVTATLDSIANNGSSLSGGKKTSINNFTIGYLNSGGENRRLVTGTKAGMNGLGIPISDDWDDFAEYTMCEMMNIFTAMNQTIFVSPT